MDDHPNYPHPQPYPHPNYPHHHPQQPSPHHPFHQYSLPPIFSQPQPSFPPAPPFPYYSTLANPASYPPQQSLDPDRIPTYAQDPFAHQQHRVGYPELPYQNQYVPSQRTEQRRSSLSRRPSEDSVDDWDESREALDVPDEVIEGLSGRALIERKRKWRKQEGLPGPGKNWRKGKGKDAKKGPDNQMDTDHRPSSPPRGSSPGGQEFKPDSPSTRPHDSPAAYPFTHHPQPFPDAQPNVLPGPTLPIPDPFFPNQMNSFKKGFHFVPPAPAIKFNAGYVVPDPLMNKGEAKEVRVRKWKLGVRTVRSITGKGWNIGGGWVGDADSEVAIHLIRERENPPLPARRTVATPIPSIVLKKPTKIKLTVDSAGPSDREVSVSVATQPEAEAEGAAPMPHHSHPFYARYHSQQGSVNSGDGGVSEVDSAA